MKKSILTLATLVSLLTLVGCGTGEEVVNNNQGNGVTSSPVNTTSSTPSYPTFAVTFDSLGGSSIETQHIYPGNPIALPDAPEYDGYNFLGWYTSSAFEEETRWDFSRDRVNADVTLYAKYELIVEIEYTESLVYTAITGGYAVSDVGEDTHVIIPDTYEGRPVIAIAERAFARKNVVSVTIPDSVTSIGLNAFNNCSSLVTVNLSASSTLATIGNNAFSGCTSLTSIALPATLNSVGDSVFNNDGALETITVASGNTVYSSKGNNLIHIPTQTLLRGTNNSVIPEGVKTIATRAFGRANITTIYIPASVTTIANYAFQNCVNLETFNVSRDNPNYASRDGILYSKAMTYIIQIPDAIKGEITIPRTILSISSMEFDGYTGLTIINLPDTINSIGAMAFRGISVIVNYNGTTAEWNEITKNKNWDMGVVEFHLSTTDNPYNPSVAGVRLSLSFNSDSVTIVLTDSVTTRELVASLRTADITWEFEDYNSVEKIAYLTNEYDTTGVPGVDPKVGDVAIYKPWNNIAIFYNDTVGYSDSVVLLGTIENDGITKLASINTDFTATLSII